MEDQIKRIVEQLFSTEDLREVQNLALELQHAVYGHIEQLQKKLAQIPYVQSDKDSFIEIGPMNPSFDGLHSEPTDEEIRAEDPTDV